MWETVISIIIYIWSSVIYTRYTFRDIRSGKEENPGILYRYINVINVPFYTVPDTLSVSYGVLRYLFLESSWRTSFKGLPSKEFLLHPDPGRKVCPLFMYVYHFMSR